MNLSHSARIYLVTGVYSAVLNAVLLVAPVINGPLTEKFALDPSQIGLLFSLELGAFSLATVPAYFWLTRVPLLWSVGPCTVIVAAGHLASGFVTDFSALLVIRFVTSLAAGSITVVLLSLGPLSKNPGRAFGIFVVSQLVMGAVILAIFPAVFQGRDVAAIYWTLAVLTFLALPAAALTRPLSVVPAEGADRPGRTGIALPLTAGLAAIAMFYVALSGIWTFMAQIAMAAGNSEAQTSLVLAFATAAGIVSALLATALGESPRRGMYLTLGLALMAVSVLLLLGTPGLVQFIVSALIFKFMWTFVLPYLLGAVAALGGGPQTMNTVNLMIGGGFAAGPALAGVLIDSTGGFTAIIVVSTAALLIALVLVLVLLRGIPRPGAADRAAHQPAPSA